MPTGPLDENLNTNRNTVHFLFIVVDMIDTTPILVAPRPVRIASESGVSSYAIRSGTPYRLVSAVADHFERAKIGGDMDIDEQRTTSFVESTSLDKDLASTRSSPR